MKPFEIDGIRMTKAEVTKNREGQVQLRDTAINAGMLDWAFTISLTIGILHRLIEELEE